ncbi:MAG: tRNA (guanosine(46)-N7)-methyltransferase TrmB [Kiritimatiellia bacterium]|nr:tRNA (guanosine(46)-N7)-methyltransferase TrmB [Kiritimatiellia bacterium]
MIKEIPSLRIRPDDWLGPLDLDGAYPAKPARIEADIGCGKGRFLLARAAAHPETAFLGIDRMLGRLRKIERAAARQMLPNIRLLRCEAAYAVAYLLPDGCLDEAFVFFPDPWPKARHHENRLFSTPFLDFMSRKLKPGGGLHVATDHLPYFEEILERVSADTRFQTVETFVPGEAEQTDFERLYLNVKTIGRASWQRLPR